MPFEIHTNDSTPSTYHVERCSILMDDVLDDLGEGATQAQIDDLVSQAIIGDLRGPKTSKTVRAHFVRWWPMIAPLSSREPELFDSILSEYSERISMLKD